MVSSGVVLSHLSSSTNAPLTSNTSGSSCGVSSADIAASGDVVSASQQQQYSAPVVCDQPALMLGEYLQIAMPLDDVWATTSQRNSCNNRYPLLVSNGAETGLTQDCGYDVLSSYGVDQQYFLPSGSNANDGAPLVSEAESGVSSTEAPQEQSDCSNERERTNGGVAGTDIPGNVCDDFASSKQMSCLSFMTTVSGNPAGQSQTAEITFDTDMGFYPSPNHSNQAQNTRDSSSGQTECLGSLLDIDQSLCDQSDVTEQTECLESLLDMNQPVCDQTDVTELSDLLDLSSSFAQDCNNGILSHNTTDMFHPENQFSEFGLAFTSSSLALLSDNPLQDCSPFMAESHPFANAVLGNRANSSGVASTSSLHSLHNGPCPSVYPDSSEKNTDSRTEAVIKDRQNDDADDCMQQLFNALDDLSAMTSEKDNSYSNTSFRSVPESQQASYSSVGSEIEAAACEFYKNALYPVPENLGSGQNPPLTLPLNTKNTPSSVCPSVMLPSIYSIRDSPFAHTKATSAISQSQPSVFSLEFPPLSSVTTSTAVPVFSQNDVTFTCLQQLKNAPHQLQPSHVSVQYPLAVQDEHAFLTSIGQTQTSDVVLTADRGQETGPATSHCCHAMSDVMLMSAGEGYADCLEGIHEAEDGSIPSCIRPDDSGLPQETFMDLNFTNMCEGTPPSDSCGNFSVSLSEADHSTGLCTGSDISQVADCEHALFCLDIENAASAMNEPAANAGLPLNHFTAAYDSDREKQNLYDPYAATEFEPPYERRDSEFTIMNKEVSERQHDDSCCDSTVGEAVPLDVDDGNSDLHQEGADDERMASSDNDSDITDTSRQFYDNSTDDESGIENFGSNMSKYESNEDETAPTRSKFKLPPFHTVFLTNTGW